MKKLFLSILSITIFTFAFADSTNVYKEIKKDVKDVFNGVSSDAKDVLHGVDSSFAKLADSSQVTFGTVYKDMKNGIEQMAAALKVGASHVYEVLVRQQIAKSVLWLVISIITTIILRVAWKISHVGDWKETSENEILNEPRNGRAVLSIVLWIMGIICLIVTIFHLDTMVYGFVNPEYGAMTDIVDFVNQIKNGVTK